MGPSEYELEATEAVQRFKGRPLSQGMRWAGDKAADGFAALGDNADKFLESHPKAELAVSRGKEVATKGAKAIVAPGSAPIPTLIVEKRYQLKVYLT